MLIDFATRQDIEGLTALLKQVLTNQAAPAPAPSPDDLLSIEQVAAYTGFDRRTVEQWRQAGRFNDKGKRVYLPAFEFSGRLRFKRADVEAFGLGVGVLQPPAAPGQPPTATKKAKPKKQGPMTSEQALRVAS